MKLKTMAILLCVVVYIVVIVIGWRQSIEDDRAWKAEQAVAHSYSERPVYYGRD